MLGVALRNPGASRTPAEQANAERLITCMRSQDRERLFVAYQLFEPRIEVANESAIVLLMRLAEKECDSAE